MAGHKRNNPNPPKDITGQRFGRWTALKRIPPTKPGGSQWDCRCDCGKKRRVYLTHLTRGASTSCGCHARNVNTTHGLSGSDLDRRHKAMKQRCENPNYKQYPNYGGRGIAVCDEWQDLATFAAWALATGYRPELQIDRIDNDKGYSPDNCRWVTPAQNMQNLRRTVRITVRGENLSLSEAARKYGISKETLRGRLRNGIEPDLAILATEEIYGPNTSRRALIVA